MGEAAMSMPRYKCHKEVAALKISKIQFRPKQDGAVMYFAEPGYAPMAVTDDFIIKHEPKVVGYYVVYADGYASYSPAGAFEEGYTRI